MLRPTSIDELWELLGSAQESYFGEPVTQLQHALQCAELARASGADHDMIIAALLHDIGHLLEEGDATGVVNHDQIGAACLGQLGFSQRVQALVAGHVQAKRYLTVVKPDYYNRLSEASKRTLAEQGGPMSKDEADEFEDDPLFADKLKLRIWDEKAKDPDREVPDLDSYREVLERRLKSIAQSNLDVAP